MDDHMDTQKSLPLNEDDIYPVHTIDNLRIHRSMIMGWTLRFNDVLNADLLHDALERLLNIGDWRKIGGRLRLKKSGQLEIYVPRPFTAQRPAVTYSHKLLATSIDEHVLAKHIPRTPEFSSVHKMPVDFWKSLAGEDTPTTLEDFLRKDIPQLSLCVTSFNDATLVALSFPHTMTDAMGQGALLRAWSLVLAGRESEVPPLAGARHDAIWETLDKSSAITDRFILGSKRLNILGLCRLGLYFVIDMLRDWWIGDVEFRHIFLGAKTMHSLREQARDEARAVSGDDKIFISDGDVLTAWAARSVAVSLRSYRPVMVLQALNVRYRLSSMVSALGVFVQNSNVYAVTSLPVAKVSSCLGHVALEVRRQLVEQATEAQVLAYLSELRRNAERGRGTLILPGPSNAVVIAMTNWGRANMFSAADFSPVVVHAGEIGPARKNPSGTMVFHDMQALGPKKPPANIFAVLGKDHGENYWLLASLRSATWAVIEADLRRAATSI